MHYPFKERQYSPLSFISPGKNLHILKWKCNVPLKKASSRQPNAAPWPWHPKCFSCRPVGGDRREVREVLRSTWRVEDQGCQQCPAPLQYMWAHVCLHSWKPSYASAWFPFPCASPSSPAQSSERRGKLLLTVDSASSFFFFPLIKVTDSEWVKIACPWRCSKKTLKTWEHAAHMSHLH